MSLLIVVHDFSFMYKNFIRGSAKKLLRAKGLPWGGGEQINLGHTAASYSCKIHLLPSVILRLILKVLLLPRTVMYCHCESVCMSLLDKLQTQNYIIMSLFSKTSAE
jgi:hypothetical protein